MKNALEQIAPVIVALAMLAAVAACVKATGLVPDLKGSVETWTWAAGACALAALTKHYAK